MIVTTAENFVNVSLDNLQGGAFLETGTTVDITGGTIQNATIDITDVNGDGNLDKTVDYIGTGGTITFTGYTVTFGGQVYPIFSNGGSHFLVIDAAGVSAFSSATFPITTNPNIDNATTYLCFAEGTMIAAQGGETAVEDLCIGDLVETASGDLVPVKWIGRQTVFTRFGPAERLRPVRVAKGALGDGLPVRDLVLTADHALLIDGLLINAAALVNGETIDWVPLTEFDGSYTVYHIETENHDIILAEGTPAETFIDYVGRQSFDNYAEYQALYGEDRTIPEMAYPRISASRLVPSRLRALLAAQDAA